MKIKKYNLENFGRKLAEFVEYLSRQVRNYTSKQRELICSIGGDTEVNGGISMRTYEEVTYGQSSSAERV